MPAVPKERFRIAGGDVPTATPPWPSARCCPHPGAAGGGESAWCALVLRWSPGRRGFEPYCVVCGSQDYGGPHDLPRVRSARESGTAGPLSRCRDLLRQLLEGRATPRCGSGIKSGIKRPTKPIYLSKSESCQGRHSHSRAWIAGTAAQAPHCLPIL